LELNRPYFDKFYDVLKDMNTYLPFKYLQTFFRVLLPRMEVSDAHIVRLVELKLETADTQGPFGKVIQNGIESLLQSKNVREYARKHAAE